MSRYRPPRPPSSAYITPDGFERLSTELKTLWKVERPEVTKKVSEAAAQGDRSENADYIYGKRRLREIDSRIQYLSKRLDKLTVVDRAPPDAGAVFFGAWVTLELDDANEVTYRIVGPDEIDPSTNSISIDAPVARALIKKRIEDEIELPLGVAVITDIRYSGAP